MNLLRFGQSKTQRFFQYFFDKDMYINIKRFRKMFNKNFLFC